MRLLVSHDADVNARSSLTNVERQVTAEPRMQQRSARWAHAAAVCGSLGCLACARALVRGGAGVNLADRRPSRRSSWRASISASTLARLLVKEGAELNVWDTWGRSPLYSVVDMNTLPTGGRAVAVRHPMPRVPSS